MKEFLEVTTSAEKKAKISKEDFEDYEAIRDSGITNMFNVRMVSDLSGLSGETIKLVMKNYSKLCEKFPGVRQ